VFWFLPIHHLMKEILDQRYVGDITIAPPPSLTDYLGLLSNPTVKRLFECLTSSERSTWTKMAVIRGSCEVEFTLDECVRRMRGQLVIDGLTYYSHVMPGRICSWTADSFRQFQ